MAALRALALFLGLSVPGPVAGVAICGITQFNTASECNGWMASYEEDSTCPHQNKAAGILVLGPGATFQDFEIDDNEVAISGAGKKQFTGTSGSPYTCAVSKNIELVMIGNETLDVNSLTFQGVTATFQNINITDDHTGDDGIELFNSTVSVDTLFVVNSGDDNVDLDDGSELTVSGRLVVQDTSTAARADKKGAAVEMSGAGTYLHVNRFEFSHANDFNEGHWYFKQTVHGISIKLSEDTTHVFTDSTWSGPALTSTEICGIMVVDTPQGCQNLTGTFRVAGSCTKPTGILVIGEGVFDDFLINSAGEIWNSSGKSFGTAGEGHFCCAIGNLVLDGLGNAMADVNSITFQGVDVTIESLKVVDTGFGDDGVELFESTAIVQGLLEIDSAGDDFLDLDTRSKLDVRGELKIKGSNGNAAGVEMSGKSQLYAKKVTFDSPADSFGEGHVYMKKGSIDGFSCPPFTECYEDVDVRLSYTQPSVDGTCPTPVPSPSPAPSPSPVAAVTTDSAPERRSAILLLLLAFLARVNACELA